MNEAGSSEKAQKSNGEILPIIVRTILIELGSPWMRASELPSVFRSRQLARQCTHAGWLRPILQGKRRTIYALTDVLACIARIERGEVPPQLPRKIV